MIGTLRTLSQKTREKARAGMTRIVEHIALAHGLTAEVRIDDGYPVTMCDPRAVALIKQVSDSFEEGQWQPMPARSWAARISAMSCANPRRDGVHRRRARRQRPGENPPLHNTKMTIEESVMAKGVAMHCAYAERFLENGFD